MQLTIDLWLNLRSVWRFSRNFGTERGSCAFEILDRARARSVDGRGRERGRHAWRRSNRVARAICRTLIRYRCGAGGRPRVDGIDAAQYVDSGPWRTKNWRVSTGIEFRSGRVDYRRGRCRGPDFPANLRPCQRRQERRLRAALTALGQDMRRGSGRKDRGGSSEPQAQLPSPERPRVVRKKTGQVVQHDVNP